MDLNENTTYKDMASSLAPMMDNAYKRARPAKKPTQPVQQAPQMPSGQQSTSSNLGSQQGYKYNDPVSVQSNALSKRGFDTSQYSSLASGVNQKFGNVSVPYGGSTRYESFHPGIDIANKIGTPIPSFSGGKVIKSVPSGQVQGNKGYGNYVIIEDRQGNKHRYSHLQQAYVKIGQNVAPGMVIGSMGATGQTYSASGKGTGSHLDYRIKNLYDKWVNPNSFIK